MQLTGNVKATKKGVWLQIPFLTRLSGSFGCPTARVSPSRLMNPQAPLAWICAPPTARMRRSSWLRVSGTWCRPGLVFEIPTGFEGQIRPRSGLALKHGITCLNTPGTIDSDYRGEVQVLLINLGQDDFVIERGMRIAQMIIAPVLQARLEERELAQATERGTGGFGSTGRQ